MPTQPTLNLAFELGSTTWKLAFTTAMAQPPRIRSLGARDPHALQREIARARPRFGPSDPTVVSCYEAGRDGFRIHRYPTFHHIQDHVVDAASIEVNRRANGDGIDVAKLVSMLIRYRNGEIKLWSVVRPPARPPPATKTSASPGAPIALKRGRTGHSNRIKGLPAGLAGLTPTPYRSGASLREQGISEAGNRRVRRLMVELAWRWLRHRPGAR